MKDKIMMLFGFRKGGTSHDNNSLTLIMFSLGLIILLTLFEINYLEGRALNIRIGGLAVFLIGAVIRTTARLQLGKLFTFNVKIMPEHKLKQDGLYAYIRHPGYTGLILEVLGWVVFFQTWLGSIAAALVFLPSMYYRIQVEERILKEKFGKQFDEYSQRVKTLIPFIF